MCKCGKEIWEEDCDDCYWKCVRPEKYYKEWVKGGADFIGQILSTKDETSDNGDTK